MLYQLLAEQMPNVDFGTKVPPFVVLERVLRGPPRALRDICSQAPDELIAICERAMARNPEHRHADMMAMANDLQAFLGNRPVARPSVLQRGRAVHPSLLPPERQDTWIVRSPCGPVAW